MDADGSRWLLGDAQGKLSLLVLSHDGPRVLSLALEPLGTISAPETLTYLDSGVIHVGSCSGQTSCFVSQAVWNVWEMTGAAGHHFSPRDADLPGLGRHPCRLLLWSVGVRVHFLGSARGTQWMWSPWPLACWLYVVWKLGGRSEVVRDVTSTISALEVLAYLDSGVIHVGSCSGRDNHGRSCMHAGCNQQAPWQIRTTKLMRLCEGWWALRHYLARQL